MKIIRRIEAVLFPFMFLLSLFVILKLRFLPSYGIQVTVNTTGTSMAPTIREGCLAICDENYPFEDVKVGDIICFKEREPVLFGSSSAVIAFTLASAPASDPTEPYTEAATETSVDISSLKDKDAEDAEAMKATAEFSFEESGDKESTEAEGADVIYTDSITMHRVVEIKDGSLITEGDGNGYRDQLPVLPSGFIGKYIFHMNYIGWPLRILTNKWVFAVLCFFMFFLGGVDLMVRIRSSRSHSV